jgi:hypothetical protein
MKSFYVDLVRGAKVALLAGPFESEAEAREWVRPAVALANELDPRSHFDPFGVVGIDDYAKPGVLNARLAIPAEQLKRAA